MCDVFVFYFFFADKNPNSWFIDCALKGKKHVAKTKQNFFFTLYVVNTFLRRMFIYVFTRTHTHDTHRHIFWCLVGLCPKKQKNTYETPNELFHFYFDFVKNFFVLFCRLVFSLCFFFYQNWYNFNEINCCVYFCVLLILMNSNQSTQPLSCIDPSPKNKVCYYLFIIIMDTHYTFVIETSLWKEKMMI